MSQVLLSFFGLCATFSICSHPWHSGIALRPTGQARGMRTVSDTLKPPGAPSTRWGVDTSSGSTQTSAFGICSLGFFWIMIPWMNCRFIARKQVSGFSDGKWKKSATWDEAVAVWDDMCQKYHQHDNDDNSAVESPPSSPSPSSPSSLASSPRLPRSPPAVAVSQCLARVSARGDISPSKSIPRHGPVASSASKSVARAPPFPSPSSAGRQPTIALGPRRVVSTRNPGVWAVGETLWGIEGVALFFEDRYAFLARQMFFN
jgi:hypothetical protein